MDSTSFVGGDDLARDPCRFDTVAALSGAHKSTAFDDNNDDNKSEENIVMALSNILLFVLFPVVFVGIFAMYRSQAIRSTSR